MRPVVHGTFEIDIEAVVDGDHLRIAVEGDVVCSRRLDQNIFIGRAHCAEIARIRKLRQQIGAVVRPEQRIVFRIPLSGLRRSRLIRLDDELCPCGKFHAEDLVDPGALCSFGQFIVVDEQGTSVRSGLPVCLRPVQRVAPSARKRAVQIIIARLGHGCLVDRRRKNARRFRIGEGIYPRLGGDHIALTRKQIFACIIQRRRQNGSRTARSHAADRVRGGKHEFLALLQVDGQGIDAVRIRHFGGVVPHILPSGDVRALDVIIDNDRRRIDGIAVPHPFDPIEQTEIINFFLIVRIGRIVGIIEVLMRICLERQRIVARVQYLDILPFGRHFAETAARSVEHLRAVLKLVVGKIPVSALVVPKPVDGELELIPLHQIGGDGVFVFALDAGEFVFVREVLTPILPEKILARSRTDDVKLARILFVERETRKDARILGDRFLEVKAMIEAGRCKPIDERISTLFFGRIFRHRRALVHFDFL